jgi:hypothetical protein
MLRFLCLVCRLPLFLFFFVFFVFRLASLYTGKSCWHGMLWIFKSCCLLPAVYVWLGNDGKGSESLGSGFSVIVLLHALFLSCFCLVYLDWLVLFFS